MRGIIKRNNVIAQAQGSWEGISVILGSAIAWIAFALTYFASYGIAFLLFCYHRKDVNEGKWLPGSVALGFTTAVFAVIYASKLLSNSSQITVEEVENCALSVLIASWLALSIIIVAVVIVRDR